MPAGQQCPVRGSSASAQWVQRVFPAQDCGQGVCQCGWQLFYFLDDSYNNDLSYK